MVYRIIDWWATIFLRMYFRRTIVYGREFIPEKGPLIVASNHPSAFLEASIMGTILGRPLHYLVRGDMFHPRFRWLFNWTNQIPIYRQKDGMSNLRKNASSFDLTYRKLSEGEAVLIFPEAKTILEKKMRPIQRGTAHLAFGTLPFIKDGETLQIIPVAVNFTDPRIPGTDVVVRFGKPFTAVEGTREDREAIDEFTNRLSDEMSRLIIQIQEPGDERLYEVLASVYLKMINRKGSGVVIHNDLVKISNRINEQHALQPSAHLKEYVQDLRKRKLNDLAFFPELVINPRLILLIKLCLKMIWMIVGGWIWRLARHLVFSKIKTNTFQGPTSVGAAMVLFPLLTFLFLLVCLLFGLPFWYVLVWLLVLWAGIFFRPPLHLMWRVLMLSPKIKTKWKAEIKTFKKEILSLI